uniref:WW domain-binding protein 2-like n=1 Tax=Rhizophora mucronata TaxID=61149 RepID=A0A2P2LB86_RHIMU
MDHADFFVAEAPVRFDLEFKGEAVLLEGSLVDGEFHGEIPTGVGPTALVDMGLLFLVRRGIAFDGNHRVNVHLGEEIDIFQVIG